MRPDSASERTGEEEHGRRLGFHVSCSRRSNTRTTALRQKETPCSSVGRYTKVLLKIKQHTLSCTSLLYNDIVVGLGDEYNLSSVSEEFHLFLFPQVPQSVRSCVASAGCSFYRPCETARRHFFLPPKNRRLLRKLQVLLMYLTLSFDSSTILPRVQASLVTHWFHTT